MKRKERPLLYSVWPTFSCSVRGFGNISWYFCIIALKIAKEPKCLIIKKIHGLLQVNSQIVHIGLRFIKKGVVFLKKLWMLVLSSETIYSWCSKLNEYWLLLSQYLVILIKLYSILTVPETSVDTETMTSLRQRLRTMKEIFGDEIDSTDTAKRKRAAKRRNGNCIGRKPTLFC